MQKNKIVVDSPKELKKLISKTQQRFKSEKQNVVTEEIKKTALSSHDDKRMRSIKSIETLYGMNKDLVCKKNNIIKQCNKTI